MERRQFLGSLLFLAADAMASDPSPLLLANPFRDDIPVEEYWVSEKYDGVRAFWSGRELLTRAGNRIAAPPWFLERLPDVALDGELWMGRGAFQSVMATVRDAVPSDTDWQRIRFMVFDLPQHPGTFDQRLAAMRGMLESIPAWMQIVTHSRIGSREALFAALDRIVAEGAEGLMLHRGDSFYRAERSDDLLKLKPLRDAEARVIDHLPGKGKYAAMLGALRVQRPDGAQFNLGSGFTDAQRRNPPPLGSWVTYSFQGETSQGLPRFARFVRVREDFRPPR